jgi:N-acetylmuramoyl-L-alanine amidase
MRKRIIFFFCLLLTGCVARPPIAEYPYPDRQTICRPKAGIETRKQENLNKGTLIVIDPGHGGDDFGAHSNTHPRYQEKYLNLSTAKLLNTYLTQKGYRTVMTRQDDTFIALDKRAEFANQKKPAVFVSVHYNSAPSKQAEGVEVYYYRSEENKKRSKDSRLLAQAVLDEVIDNTNAKSRGTKHGDFAVIRETDMAAILVEGGFLTNEKEMQRIRDPMYLKKLAWGIAQGIDNYLKK